MYLDNEKQKAELMHFGVPGMRWGHRKASGTTSSTSPNSGSTSKVHISIKKAKRKTTNQQIDEMFDADKARRAKKLKTAAILAATFVTMAGAIRLSELQGQRSAGAKAAFANTKF